MSTMSSPRAILAAGQFELVAKALADPRRVAVLEAIADDACCARLRDRFPVTKATISHHIKELVRAGVVEARRKGQYLHCLVRREVLEAYAAELLRRVGADPGNNSSRESDHGHLDQAAPSRVNSFA
jgi:ArsR family transcriptional regulator